MKWLKRFDSRHPLLNMYAVIKAFDNNILGTECKNIIITSKDNKVTLYKLIKENEDLKELWKKKFLDEYYMGGRFRWFNQNLDQVEILVRTFKRTKFEEFTDWQLFDLYQQYFELFRRIFQGHIMSLPEVTEVGEEELKHKLSNYCKDNGKVVRLLSEITTPSKTHVLIDEELNWLRLLVDIKQQGLTENILSKIKKHSENYGWLSTQEGLAFFDANYYMGLAKNNSEEISSILKRIENIKNQPANVENKRKEVLDKIKDKQIDELSERLRETGHLRILNRLAWTKLEYYAGDLFKELSKRVKVNFEKIKYFFPQEIKKILMKKESVNIGLIEERMNNHVMFLNNGEFKLYIGGDADEIVKNEIVEETRFKEIKGNCASPGFVKGKVKIIHSHVDDQLAEVAKMEQGDILVAGSTKPQLIVACRKASAIVTDEGGICSHAAIVSREFGIPCVVGTSVATKVLKDGDYIEVDATKGIVKKIESTPHY